MQNASQHDAVLTITAKMVTCDIRQATGDESQEMIGFGWCRSYGIEDGRVTDARDAEMCVRAAVGAAENMAEVRLNSVILVLFACLHIEPEGVEQVLNMADLTMSSWCYKWRD